MTHSITNSLASRAKALEQFLDQINDALHDKDNIDAIESDPHGGALMYDWIRDEFDLFYETNMQQHQRQK